MTGPAPQVIEIRDPGDPRLEDYRNLRGDTPRRRGRRPSDNVVVEGHLAVRRCLEGPVQLRSVLMTPQRAESLGELRARMPAAVPTFVARRSVLEQLTGFDVHRGVLASARRPAPRDPGELLTRHPRVVVLNGLTDLENVGAAFRATAALDLGAVLVDHRCADPLHRRCVRVSLGWSTVIPHARLDRSSDVIDVLKASGHRSVALTPRRSAVPVDRAAREGLLADPVGLLVGSEGPGLAEATIDSAEIAVVIPMAEGVDSLNAATALAVVGSFAAAARGWQDGSRPAT